MPIKVIHGIYTPKYNYLSIRNNKGIEIKDIPKKFKEEMNKRKPINDDIPFTLAIDEETGYQAIAICSEKDNFVRKVGKTIALQRLQFAIDNKETRRWIYLPE